MSATRKSIFYLTLVLFVVRTTFVCGAKLGLPVELSIENGDYKNCVVSITKNGIQQQALPGKSLLNIKLDFNKEYILSFSKPGYITKKIAVNTTVTPERELQQFEPYKIGVKLFKQYEGINIVVYNQPVAKIKFNPMLDDFDYDVDYTKSILSQLQSSEQELEIRATEERRLIASGELPKEGFGINAASSERFAQFPKIKGAQGISPENKTGSDASFPVYPSEVRVDTAILNGGADNFSPSMLNNGSEPPPSGNMNNGDDGKLNPTNAKGINKASGVLNVDKGQDKSKTISGSDNFDLHPRDDLKSLPTISSSDKINTNEGADNVNAAENLSPDGSIKTKELTIEPNRTITTIKVNDGQNAIIYRKVLYNWGGLYYFKNLSYSISQDIFETGTGEK